MVAIAAAQAKANAEAVKRFGMHYQWGRKDPFTPRAVSGEVQIYKANGTAITKGVVSAETISEQFKFEDKVITTINHLIQNPSTHYYKGDGTNEVPIAGTTDLTKYWWNPTIKTIYDPCPNGYRIPKSGTYGEASEWTKSDPYSGLISGYTWDNTLSASFFPASGYRYSTSGTFGLISSFGFYWMSTPSNSRGFNMHFHSKTIYSNSNHPRSHSFTTRCIKE